MNQFMFSLDTSRQRHMRIIPEAVHTVIHAPDDERKYRSKHVEQ